MAALGADPPQSSLIVGPPGVGRSRLCREALDRARVKGLPVRWASATAPAARVPLGALGHLLPDIDPAAAGPLLLLQRARAALGRLGNRPPVLAVDDVHLLDPLSLTLLHQLAASGAATLLLTVRTERATPNAAASFWKDGLARRIDLQPLSRDDAEHLVGTALGGRLESRTAERLWRLTLGTPLYLTEIVEEGCRTGQLSRAAGLWRWEGPMIPSPRLSELVLAHLQITDPAEWRALEVLAVGEPIDVAQLTDLSSPQAVTALESRGLIADDAGGSGALRATHPLYTEVVRSCVSEAILRSLRRQLTYARPLQDSDRLVRRSLALLDSDLPSPDAALLTTAAERAMAGLDLAAAARLARAGMERGGPAAALMLVEATRWLGEPEQGEEAAVEAADLAVTATDRVRVTVARALTLACGLHRLEEAADLVGQLPPQPLGSEEDLIISAAGRIVAMRGGAAGAAGALGDLPVTAAGSRTPPLALAVRAVEQALAGRWETALSAANSGWALVRSTPRTSERVLAHLLLCHAEVVAQLLGGRIADLRRRTLEWHRQNLELPEWAGDAVLTLYRGWSELAAGRLGEASVWLAEARAGFARYDPLGLDDLCRGLQAMTGALRGDAPDIRRPAGGRGVTEAVPLPSDSPWDRFADACVAGAQGRAAVAAGLVIEAADLAAGRGHIGVAALMLHHGLRHGRHPELASRLAGLAVEPGAPLVVMFAQHADALRAGDAAGLEAVSVRFEEAGALLCAAEAAAEAAAAHEAGQSPRRGAACRARALRLAGVCGLSGGLTPASLALPTLTIREQEIATLAAEGLSNQDIADRFVLSVRTVETHLSHVYTKFGIASRAELATALEMAAPAPV